MATARPETQPNLTAELQAQFNFTHDDPTQRWLQSDTFDHASLGGVEVYEWLPTRTRVLADGTRFEMGTRKVDIEGLLELAKIIHPRVKGVDDVINFWQGRPNIKVIEDKDWVYMGVDIEPTTEGFESKFSQPEFAFSAALTAAIEGKSYLQMRRNRWHGSFMKNVEELEPNSRAGIFAHPRSDRAEVVSGSSCELPPIITAANLSEFPLETYKTSLHTPVTIVEGGRRVLRDDYAWVIAHNGEEIVAFHLNRRNWQKKRPDSKYIGLGLPIPEGVEVKSFADLAKLTRGVVYHHTYDSNPESVSRRETDVKVEVGKHRVRVVTADGNFRLEVEEPACDNCQTPEWKFRKPTPAEDEWNPHPEIYLERKDNERYCLDCKPKLEQEFADAHPFARRSKALAEGRKRLDNLGFTDVELWEDQVFPIGAYTRRGGFQGWELFTRIKYSRNGREIIRMTGIPVLSVDGELKIPEMMSREFVDFRYKT